jgi:transcriptional regulator with XRE-family HTH domain
MAIKLGKRYYFITMARRTYLPATREAVRLLATSIAVARRERGWTVEELAERVGVTHTTMRRVERGELGVAVGTVLEAAVILGLPLFGDDPAVRRLESRRLEERLALLPRRVRTSVIVDDDF